ncbi:hypothetical protein ACJQWK_08192 [Exserohilum turcicum]|uniref:Uncharacterized protein n=1 Tax=Exserohilum turcicum (strain 28A) TaxID=671987 RepID=R0KE15_EXST2|nr:uncharacterized protein SETTUDRAFT_168984 [Exserohilum turcica Et28A]EOA87559.1 hypothetical protein SETTUDRAFT_168984 [Exserohilum turcica Et28A]
MAPIRPSTPPLRASTMKQRDSSARPPATPTSSSSFAGDNFNMISRSEHATVPPSPNALPPYTEALAMDPAPERKVAGHKNIRKSNARTGAGVQKAGGRTRPKAFRFMDLPGEIRNQIYMHTQEEPKQALLVHRPRIASLRPRTRADRVRTLPSDIAEQEYDKDISNACSDGRDSGKTNPTPRNFPRETNRPFWGLTQVCRQLRYEYRPIYMAKQEIGLDLTAILPYLEIFYPSAPIEIAKLAASERRKCDMPFVGNLTIAVSDVPTKLERRSEGTELLPLLEIWANSIKMEAGFGRYMKEDYHAEIDGEAKDLYRLFGRRVLRNRSCGAMNNLWRKILRSRSLASVRIHRNPSMILSASTSTLFVQTGAMATPQLAAFPIVLKPYIHLIFKKEAAEAWMTDFESMIPKQPVDWLAQRGFGHMEYFDVRVGVEQTCAK